MISILVVTLIAGLEGLLFVIVSLYAYFALVEPSLWPLALVLLLFRLPLIWPQETVIALVSGCTVCVSGFVSFSALKRELSSDREGFVENKRRQRLKGLLLACALVWTWLSLRYVIVHFMSTRYMDLRIVLAASRDVGSHFRQLACNGVATGVCDANARRQAEDRLSQLQEIRRRRALLSLRA
ncbi:hypothetical protein [Bradyrhizobium genosp. A]|uniref:hypothetical protein n=1 Tax=Bradyrhizobium genosp. A TaxID=83626 RepID=UPI003CEF71C2